MTNIAIIDSGVANLASMRCAFESLGAAVTITSDPSIVMGSTHVVLPGVGSFSSGMAALRSSGMDRAILDTSAQDRPLLAVCLGMQMLGEESEESPGVSGLGIVKGNFTELPPSVRVPHLGWNGVLAEPRSTLVCSGDAAFANSYCLTESPVGWEAAWTTHGVRFVSALARGRTLACQFHPELSGMWGLDLLARWMNNRTNEMMGTATVNRLEVASRIVPCLDVKNGRVVKGVNFQNLRDAGDPATQAAAYEAQGADEIVVLDIVATPSEQETQLETVRAVRVALRIPLTVGGGVRNSKDARSLLAAGADKVSTNTAAVRSPSLLSDLAREFGSQCVVLAIDARRKEGGWEVLVSGGREPTGMDAVMWAAEGVALGAGEILITSWDRDGTRSGCDETLLEAVSRSVGVPVIASGGIGCREDVAAALRAGADAVLAASVFHDGDQTVSNIKQYLKASGLVVRL